MATSITTSPQTRFSYAFIKEPNKDGVRSVALLIDKNDPRVPRIKQKIQEAYDEGKDKLKGKGKVAPALSVINYPLRDGDLEKPGEELYEGKYFMNAKYHNDGMPKIIDKKATQELLRSGGKGLVYVPAKMVDDYLGDPDNAIYSGAYGVAEISFFAYDNQSKGIACSLQAIGKWKDGEPLGGTTVLSGDEDLSDLMYDDDDEF